MCHSVSLRGKANRHTTRRQWTTRANTTGTAPVGVCLRPHGQGKIRKVSAHLHATVRIAASQGARQEAPADLCCLPARTPSGLSPSKARAGNAGAAAVSALLEFISICFFRLLSRIIVLLGLEAWEGRRCALLFINSLNACFKLKPTPHAGSHRSSVTTGRLPAVCYQRRLI